MDATIACAIDREPDEKIVAARSVHSPPHASIFTRQDLLLRSYAHGSPDTSFGDGGAVLTTFSMFGNPSSAHAVALQGDSKIVVAGKQAIAGSRWRATIRMEYWIQALVSVG